MSILQGTNVIAPIRPFDTDDTFPTAFANEIKGGLHTVKTIQDMLIIPKERREVGMNVTVVENSHVYQLINDTTADATLISDWKDMSDASSFTVDDKGTTIKDKISDIYNKAIQRYIVFVINNGDLVEPSDLEFRVPFDGKVVAITSSISMNKIIIDEISYSVELYTDETAVWNTIGTVNLTKASHNNSEETVITPVPIKKGNKIRINVLKTQKDIDIIETSLTTIIDQDNG